MTSNLLTSKLFHYCNVADFALSTVDINFVAWSNDWMNFVFIVAKKSISMLGSIIDNFSKDIYDILDVIVYIRTSDLVASLN